MSYAHECAKCGGGMNAAKVCINKCGNQCSCCGSKSASAAASQSGTAAATAEVNWDALEDPALSWCMLCDAARARDSTATHKLIQNARNSQWSVGLWRSQLLDDGESMDGSTDEDGEGSE